MIQFLGLAPVAIAKIAAGLAGLAGLVGVASATYTYCNRYKIALVGEMAVGKTTLFNILLEKYDEYKEVEHKSTPNHKKDSNWTEFIVYDTSAGRGTQEEKENIIDSFKDNDMVIYVANGSELDEDLVMKVKKYKENYKNIKNFKLIITHKNKIKEHIKIRNELSSQGIGVDLEFFELRDGIDSKKKFLNLRKEIMNFLETNK